MGNYYPRTSISQGVGPTDALSVSTVPESQATAQSMEAILKLIYMMFWDKLGSDDYQFNHGLLRLGRLR